MPAVHLLMVHGVGDHDHLSNLLRTYQTFRANLTSTDVPVLAEDALRGWRVTAFDEGSDPPCLTLMPDSPSADEIAAVKIYEINYSLLAGVIRRNHPIDLTNLFLGLDAAVAAARQRQGATTTVTFGEDTALVARCFQRVAGVLAAGTIPIIGLPSLVFKQYTGTMVGFFTRFFDDVATFALDKNGERLISAHLDRTVDAIRKTMAPGDRFVLAAHSLGSIVSHNHVVRRWTNAPVPETVVTFGSPIGLLIWTWLFLDFRDMNFRRHLGGDSYFSWKPVSPAKTARSVVTWINVVNCGDPIATTFPAAALDLALDPADVLKGLQGETLEQKYFGAGRLTDVGTSHTSYLNDRPGFIALLLRAAGLATGRPQDVPSRRTREAHWALTDRRLRTWQAGLWGAAAAFAVAYCATAAARLQTPRLAWLAAAYIWPAVTIGTLTFFHRLLFGGPTKRINRALIRSLRWRDPVSFPLRLREAVLRVVGRSKDVDPLRGSPGRMRRLAAQVLAFAPTAGLMLAPAIVLGLAGGPWRVREEVAALATTRYGLLSFGCFMAYVCACAAHELVRAWRRLLRATGAL
jgi:hypothetical protein